MAWQGAPGAKKESWADDVDETEAKGGIEAPPEPDNSAFPSLSDAAKQPQPKQKKKGQKMDMRTFMQQAGGPVPSAAPGRFVAPGSRAGPVNEKEILLSLPTGSRGRVEGEEEAGPPGMGGAFRDYGGDRGERGRGRRGGGEDGGDEYMPSRADEDRDWGASRKFTASDNEPRGRGGGGGFRDRDGGRDRTSSREPRPISQADEVADWGGAKKFEPSEPRGERAGGMGGGFRDRDAPRGRSMFESTTSKADEEEQWSRRGPPSPDQRERSRGRERTGFGFSGEPGRNPDAEDRWSRKAPLPEEEGASANGSARPPSASAPTERPRLKIAPRTKPVEPIKTSEEKEQPQGPGEEAEFVPVVKKERSNPFGAAKPREEVLREKGVSADPVKEVLKYEQGEVIRDETSEEQALQKELQSLRTDLEAFKVAGEEESDGAIAAQKELDAKEMALLKLKVENDDKVRYARRAAADSEAAEGASREGGASAREASSTEAASSSRDDKWGRKDKGHSPRAAAGGDNRRGGGDREKQEGERGGERSERGDRGGPRGERGDRGDRERGPRAAAAPGMGPSKGAEKW